MVKHRRLAQSLLALAGAIVMNVVLNTNCAVADTLAYWRFEGDGVTAPVNDQFLKDTNGRVAVQPDGLLAIDSSGNGNHLYTWDNNTTGHQYSTNVTLAAALQSGLDNDFSIRNNGGFPATFTWSLNSAPTVDIEPLKLAAWTIEASIFSTNVGSHRTFVGRDGRGSTGDTNRAPLYFKTFNGQLQILFTDEAGNSYDLVDPTGNLSLNSWYNVAAVSDGTTLSLYKDAGAGYQLVNSMALVAGDTRLNYDDTGSTTAGDTQWGWTVGRGRYGGSTLQNQSHVDRWLGNIDEVRISDVALAPSQFLFEPEFSLILEVNKTTGQVNLKNIGNDPVSMNYYLIKSAGDALNPANAPAGWNSLSDQGFGAGAPADFNNSGGPVDSADLVKWQGDYGTNAGSDADGDGDSDGRDFLIWQRTFGQGPGIGDSWDEAGGSGTDQLAELFLNSSSEIAPGQSISLGKAYNPAVFGAADGDLTFQYAAPGQPGLTSGGIVYLPALSAVTAIPEPATLSVVALAILLVSGKRFRGTR